jgi:hypothetical protein
VNCPGLPFSRLGGFAQNSFIDKSLSIDSFR